MAYLRQSKWTYDTSATLGFSLGFSVISGGMISLNDPDRNPHHFHFGAFGAGISRGLALTRIEVPQTIVRNYDFSGSVALEDFKSGGVVFMTDAFQGRELSLSDIQGVTAYIEGGVAAFSGFGGDVMFLGLDPIPFLTSIAFPGFSHLMTLAIDRAPAVLLMGGSIVGPQVATGLSALIGQLH
ncbi:hypothetical protein [Paraburkholderia xenovorans]